MKIEDVVLPLYLSETSPTASFSATLDLAQLSEPAYISIYGIGLDWSESLHQSFVRVPIIVPTSTTTIYLPLLWATAPTIFDNDALAGVTLAWFTATGGEGQVLVEWETASEVHTVGFNLWRNTSETGDYARLNDSLIPSKAIGSVTGAYYSYIDKEVINGTTYYYKLESVAADGVSEFHGPVSATAGVQPTSTPTPTQTATHTPTPTTTPPTTPYRLYLPIIVKNYSDSLSVGYGSEIRQACGHNVQINVTPSLPTQDDNVQVIASGDWYDTCIPFYQSHQVDDHVIRVDAVVDYPVGTGCADMITPWEFMVDIGKLPTGVYEVNLRITDLFNQVPTALCATKSFTVFTEVTYLPIVAK